MVAFTDMEWYHRNSLITEPILEQLVVGKGWEESLGDKNNFCIVLESSK